MKSKQTSKFDAILKSPKLKTACTIFFAACCLASWLIVNLENKSLSDNIDVHLINIPHSKKLHISRRLTEQGGAISVAWSSDSSLLVDVSVNSDKIFVWNSTEWRIIKTINREGTSVSRSLEILNKTDILTPASSPDAPRGLYAMTLFDLNEGNIKYKIPHPDFPKGSLGNNSADLFVKSNKLSAVAALMMVEPKNIYIYDSRDWSINSVLSIPKDAKDGVMSISFSHNGLYLAAGTFSGKLYLFDLRHNEGSRIIQSYPETSYMGVNALAFSPDDKLIATGAGLSTGRKTIDDSVRVFNVSTGKQLPPLMGNVNVVRDLAWNPDGDTLAVAADREILFWHLDKGTFEQAPDVQIIREGVLAERFASNGDLAVATESEIVIFN